MTRYSWFSAAIGFRQRHQSAGEQRKRQAGADAPIVERLRGLEPRPWRAFRRLDAVVSVHSIVAGKIVHFHRVVLVAAGLLGLREQIGGGLVVVVVVEREFAALRSPAARPILEILRLRAARRRRWNEDQRAVSSAIGSWLAFIVGDHQLVFILRHIRKSNRFRNTPSGGRRN